MVKVTARRKKKVDRCTATAVDMNVLDLLKRLRVNNISNIEEGNKIKENGEAIRFNNCQVQASFTAKTFTITGLSTTNQIAEMLCARCREF